jgi:hypothetical protein
VLGDGRREDFHTAGGKIPAFFEPQPAQARQLNCIWEDDDGTRQTETAQPTLLGLGVRIANFPAQLALLLELGPTEEVNKGGVQIA